MRQAHRWNRVMLAAFSILAICDFLLKMQLCALLAYTDSPQRCVTHALIHAVWSHFWVKLGTSQRPRLSCAYIMVRFLRQPCHGCLSHISRRPSTLGMLLLFQLHKNNDMSFGLAAVNRIGAKIKKTRVRKHVKMLAVKLGVRYNISRLSLYYVKKGSYDMVIHTRIHMASS